MNEDMSGWELWKGPAVVYVTGDGSMRVSLDRADQLRMDHRELVIARALLEFSLDRVTSEIRRSRLVD
jgi:hypothetical protein